MDNETIPQEDVFDPTALEPSDDATGLFMKSFETSEDGASDNDGDETPNTEDDPSSEEEVEETEEQDENDPDESDDPDEDEDQVDDDEDQEDDDEEGDLVAEDDATVTYTVNGEEHTASVGELKRLAGQDKALTVKSQKLASQFKEVEALHQSTRKILENRVEKAKALYEQYQNVDWKAVARSWSDAEYTQLEKEAKDAEAEYRFILEELDENNTKFTQAATERLKAEAQAAVTEIQDPTMPTYIPDWSEKTYGDIRGYMVANGMSQEAADEVTNPVFISAVYKAMKADNAKSQAKKTIKKAKLSPKKIAKTTKRQAKAPKGNRRKSAVANLKKSNSHSQEQITDAFMASLED